MKFFSFNRIFLHRPSMTSQTISSQYSTTGTSDSIASSYRPSEQKRVQTQLRPMFTQQQSDVNVTDELIHHPTIMKLQQQNFHRLLSSAESTSSSSSVLKQQQISQIHTNRDDDQSTYISTITNDHVQPNKSTSNTQRAVLNQRKQALMKAIYSIDKQMEELDMQ